MLRNGLIFAVVFVATSIVATALVVNRPKPSTPAEDSKAALPALIDDKPMPPPAQTPSAGTQATASTGFENDDFEGKLVWVVEDLNRDHCSLLENVHVKQIAGRTFLVGTFTYKPSSAPAPKLIGYFAVDQIKGFTIVSKDEIPKLMAQQEKPQLMQAVKKASTSGDDTSSPTLGSSSGGSSSLPPLPGFSTPRFPGESNE